MSVISRRQEASSAAPRTDFLSTDRTYHRHPGFLAWCAFSTALHSLARNKTRTFLSTLGIIVGVGCVIAMMALGEGTRVQMLEQIRRTGSALLWVRPEEQRAGAVSLGAGTGQNLTLEDAAAVAAECSAVERTSPRVSDPASVEYRNRNTRASVMGVTNDFLIMRNCPLAAGRLFRSSEVRSRARVCILGAELAEELFASQAPVGQRVQVQGQSFRVIGVVRARGENWDDDLWVPVTTAMVRLFNLDHIERIEAQATDEASLSRAAAQIESVLRRRHRVRFGEPNDFQIRNQQERLEAATQTGNILTYLLVGIASISLLVGGIGVMNIMLVSVTERTREIGIRRAIGARQGDILWQFLIEALVMCGVGAGMGLAAGFTACWVGAEYAGWPVLITTAAVALSCGFAMAIGLFFGLYPAARAAQLSPLAALRYE